MEQMKNKKKYDEETIRKLQENLPCQKTENDLKKRMKLFKDFDMDCKNLLSFSDVDQGLGLVISGNINFDSKPIIKRAFDIAKTSLKADSKVGDDFVSKAEFRYLLFYLKQYFEYYIMFSKID